MRPRLRKKTVTHSKIHVAICISHTFEFMTTTFFDLMLRLQSKYTYSIFRSNLLPLDRNRTNLVDLALKDPAVTHCLFIDTDIVPNADNFMDLMVSYDQDILGLLCTKKLPPYEPILVNKSAPQNEQLNGFWVNHPKGLVEVDAVGTGCLLVKRKVFENMERPYFKFVSSYEQDMYQSEDIYFLSKAKNKGYKAFVDTKNTCKHYGMKGYGVEDFKNATGGEYER
jgi:hypothetical protein